MSETAREIVLAALRREQPDRVPKMAEFTPALFEVFKRKTGSTDPADYWDFECRDLVLKETRLKTDFSRYHPEDVRDRITRVDEWGVGYIPGSMHHFENFVHPMAGLSSIKELEEYPWPDCTADYRREGFREKVNGLHERGYAVRSVPPNIGGTLFETAWGMRGMEAFLTDLVLNEEFAAFILDRLTEMQCDGMRFIASCDVDVVATADDVGTQRGMMMSPDMWRKWFKPRMAKVIESARAVKPDVHVWYHSDGDVRDIIPELIEIGVDVLNPVQPECMNPAELKSLYGDQLSFWGTVGTQTTMPFGTPEDVRRVVRERIETVGKDGGLLVAPTHVLEPDVPWENIVTFFDAVREFGGRT